MCDTLLRKLEDMGAEVTDTIERLGDNQALYLECLSKLSEDKNIAILRKATDEADIDTAMRAVHTLKGIALNLGLLPLLDVCMDMLLDFRDGKSEKAFSQIDKVEKVFYEWADVIKKGMN